MEYIHFAKDELSLFCFLFMCANEFKEIKRYSQNIELYEKSGFVRFKKTKTENKGFVYLEKIENRTENIKDEHYSVSWGF
ncbi:unknown [Clostridium sp. CAG:122]|nr:unknown [Clostridium sp. CAG:122]